MQDISNHPEKFDIPGSRSGEPVPVQALLAAVMEQTRRIAEQKAVLCKEKKGENYVY